MFSAGIILAVEVSIYIFLQWGWFMPFYSDDFLGRAIALSVFSSLILAAEQTNINMRGAHLILGPLFSLEIIPLSFIHSFETNWSLKLQVGYFIPALTSTTAFFPLYNSQWKVLSQADTKHFGNSPIFSSTHLFYSRLTVTGHDNDLPCY